MQRWPWDRWRFMRTARRRIPMLATLQVQLQELRVGLCRALMNAHRDQTAVALARLDKIDWSHTGLVGVPVTVSDGDGKEIARAVVSFAVTARSD